MYYRAPEKAGCADVIPFYENGEFKLFYLRDYRDISVHGEGCPWCLLTSSDLVHFHDHGPVLLRGGEEEQDLYVFTGCCIRAGEEYMIFYTGHNPHLRKKGLPEQKILRATSRDLLHWKKDRDFVFAAPDWLEMHDFRDPFVFYDEERKEYCMLIAGRLKNGDPSSARGVTLLACSPDLTHWEVEKEPFYAPHAYFTHECPDLFRIGDWWYLVFSEFTDRIVTTYRMSSSPFGPWVSPKIPDGTLAVKCPREVAAQYPDRLPVAVGRTMGSVSYQDRKYLLGGEGKSLCMLGAMPENGKIELSFSCNKLCYICSPDLIWFLNIKPSFESVGSSFANFTFVR